MKSKFSRYAAIIILLFTFISGYAGDIIINNNAADKVITFGNAKLIITLDYNGKCNISGLTVNGQSVISGPSGIFSSIKTSSSAFSTLKLTSVPDIKIGKNYVLVSNIKYGNGEDVVIEKWKFIISDSDIRFDIERDCAKPLSVEESAFPSFNFNSIKTWDGAFLGYGGLAWFYLFNQKLCTYGIHSDCSTFWNSSTGNGLKVSVSADGKKVAMKYTRSNEDKLIYNISVSDSDLTPRYEAEKRSRFIRGKTDVWDNFIIPAGKYVQTVTLSYINYNEAYNRGKFVGENGKQVTSLLNTIARIGVIDEKLFGANSWHTPYGPICLHEQYIAQFAIGINDDNYTNGYKRCLDYYRDNALQPDGRVLARWAYLNEDAMAGTVTEEGFYEAQWGYLMDSNPDFVSNVADLYNLTGDLNWVAGHKRSCEKALDYMLKRDSNGNHLVEMMTDSHSEKKGSDWIDIIWASFENAFVNAKLYHALTLWADVENQLSDPERANYYSSFAEELKISFNKSTDTGGFWSNNNKWYVHWLDKDKSVHGDNLVVPVNFMAIVYGLCDDTLKRNTILRKIEEQTHRENLFFWPICLYPYAVGEGNDWQFPFPNYENEDIFLSWGGIGVEAYADYNPDLALKYVDNVLNRYEKDGLAFQRYGRINQDGLGDDILSGNSLAIVGLYKAIYGINPVYNRLYLHPHLPGKLSGTELIYNFRNDKLRISLNTDSYSISDRQFKVTSKSDFGFYSDKNELTYFNENSDSYSLRAQTAGNISLDIIKWTGDEYTWMQSSNNGHGKVSYSIHVSEPNSIYTIYDGDAGTKSKSDLNGVLIFKVKSDTKSIRVTRNPDISQLTINTLNNLCSVNLPGSLSAGLLLIFSSSFGFSKGNEGMKQTELIGNRFLTFNAVIRVNQIEVSRNRNVGEDERSLHTPIRVIKFREAIAKGFPGSKITWALSWLALHDTTSDYQKIRDLVVGYHKKYGDEVTFIPGAYFANAYNSTEQVNKDLHEGLTRVSSIVGNYYRPLSIVAGFLSSKNQEYLSKQEGIHVCQGNIWSQFAIDNQDGDGSPSYPYYPSKEHFCKPAQGQADFIDCVNLDGWTMDFLSARRQGFSEGFNSRMGVGPIETLGKYGIDTGCKEMLHTTAIHFDRGFELNGFAWVTNCWEVSLPIELDGLTLWLSKIKKRWPDVKFITQGEFGMIWRENYKSNNFNYRFEETGSGIGGSDSDKEIRWFMNKEFRLALLKDLKNDDEVVIDFTCYDIYLKEPESGTTRNWSIMGEINQKQTRPQDKPLPLDKLPDKSKSLIKSYYPMLFVKD